MTHLTRSFLGGILLVLALVGPAAATPDEDAKAGFEADQKGDYATAMKLYTAGARGGVVYAMYNVGAMYYAGRGVDRSYLLAMKWFRQAADKNYPEARHAIGTMYQHGEGVPKSTAEAVKWYRLAADQGLLLAQNELAVILTTGEPDVPADLVQAYVWFSLAAKNDAIAGSRRDRLAARLTPQQLDEAKKLVSAWKPK